MTVKTTLVESVAKAVFFIILRKSILQINISFITIHSNIIYIMLKILKIPFFLLLSASSICKKENTFFKKLCCMLILKNIIVKGSCRHKFLVILKISTI